MQTGTCASCLASSWLLGDDFASKLTCSSDITIWWLGLRRPEEAEPLLQRSHAALQAAFGDGFEAVGEADFYLILLELGRTPPMDIPELSGRLYQAPGHFS